MFREMRRKGQSMPREDCVAVLERGTSGVLALLGDEDYPYALPISYVYDDGKLIFHSAVNGHKIDAIRKQEKASFCVTDKDEIVPDEYTTYYRSVIVFGRIHILEDEKEKRLAIEKLMKKYNPHGDEAGRESEIMRGWKALCMLEMTIEHMTGKEGRELAKRRK